MKIKCKPSNALRLCRVCGGDIVRGDVSLLMEDMPGPSRKVTLHFHPICLIEEVQNATQKINNHVRH